MKEQQRSLAACPCADEIIECAECVAARHERESILGYGAGYVEGRDMVGDKAGADAIEDFLTTIREGQHHA